MNCLAAAVAQLLNITLNEVYDAVGHRGDKIIHPDLPEPICRVGFHFDEFQPLCFERVSSILVYFTKYPQSAVCHGDETYTHAITSKFFEFACNRWPGILIGENERGFPHAQYYLAKKNELKTVDSYLALVKV